MAARQSPGTPVLRFAPLDVPAAIIADDSALLNAAIASFADFAKASCDAEPAITIRLRRSQPSTAKVGFAVDVKGSRLALDGVGACGWADSAAGTAQAWLSNDLDAAEVTETLLLFLLTRAGRTPVHAASVVIGEMAILLAGPSGSGKSSLALAAQQQGLAVLSEDTTYVQLEPKLRIWGWPGAIHVHPGESPAGDFPVRLRGGRTKAAVSRIPNHSHVERAALVMIERGRSLELQRAEPDRLLARLPAAEPGFDLLERDVETALSAIARAGAWRMTLDSSPAAAVSLLREHFGHVNARPA